MKIHDAEYIRSCVKPSQYPADGLPEVALVGRSNVGKSSLINTLAGKKRLAKTSSAPGKTRTINFYRFNRAFYLVDLPGYGFAKVPLAERLSWKVMIERYFEVRRTVKGVIVVLDSRRDPGPTESSLYMWLEGLKIPVLTVATKCDKLSRNKLSSRLSAIKKELPSSELVCFSAATGEGKVPVAKTIERMVRDGRASKNEGGREAVDEGAIHGAKGAGG